MGEGDGIERRRRSENVFSEGGRGRIDTAEFKSGSGITEVWVWPREREGRVYSFNPRVQHEDHKDRTSALSCAPLL